MPDRIRHQEAKMRRSGYGPPRWSFVSPAPGAEAKFRRWNVVLIVILAFLVLGVFVAAKAPEPDTSGSVATQASP